MGQFQKVRGEDDDDDEERDALVQDATEAEVEDYGQEHYRPSDLCMGCLTSRELVFFVLAACVFLTVALAVASIAADDATRHALVFAGSSAFGSKATVGAVHVGMLVPRTTVADVLVENPLGFSQGPGAQFLTLGEVALELGWGAFASDVWETQEVILQALQINIEQNPSGEWNVKYILDHLSELGFAQVASAGFPSSSGLLAMPHKITADRISFSGVDLRICTHPCQQNGPFSTFAMSSIWVEDVGKTRGGVPLPELLDVILQATLISAVSAAPEGMSRELHQRFGESLMRPLDYSSVLCDSGGGLQEVRFDNTWELSRLGNIANQVADALEGQGGAEALLGAPQA